MPYGLELPVLRKYQVIGGGRRNTACPHCYSSDRERLIYMFIKNHTELFNPGKPCKMLHVAPEKNLSRILIQSNHIDYHCVDRMEPGYTYAGHVQYMDILKIEFPDNHFDYIMCNHVLEHIVEDAQAMRELCRVLKPGGTGLLQVPVSSVLEDTIEDFSVTDPKAKEQLFGQFDHVRIYGKVNYKKRLATAGFTLIDTNISSDPRYAKMLLNPSEDLFVVTK